MRYLWIFLTSSGTMLLLDAVWLSSTINPLYRPRIGHLMADNVNWAPAILFYIIYNIGIVYFAVIPNLKEGSTLSCAIISGAILGAFAYATYDLTNHATLKNWPAIITMVDIIWGAFLTATCSAVCFYFFKKA